ncbi:MAG: hypothetical protein ACK53I_12660 [Phenylobacterium sp.]|jgi:hypothetical protein
MNSLLFALALAAQDPTPPAETPPSVAEDRLPAGAPHEDYPFVAWCYGALRAHIDLQDEMMPEVTRIESQFRKPGAKLEDDLAVYEQMRADGRVRLEQFQAALTAAEKASVRPINAIGGQAVRQGRQIWATGPEVSKARKAQEWMSWALPARCERVAASLEARSKLLGATLNANTEVEPPPAAAEPSAAAEPTPPDSSPPPAESQD